MIVVVLTLQAGVARVDPSVQNGDLDRVRILEARKGVPLPPKDPQSPFGDAEPSLRIRTPVHRLGQDIGLLGFKNRIHLIAVNYRPKNVRLV